MKRIALILVVIIPCWAICQTPSLTEVFSGFDSPTHLVTYKEGFIVSELRGTLKYVPDLNKDSSVVVGVIPNVSDALGNGVYGLAVHPEFSENNYIYVHYTYDTTFFESRLSRFQICQDTLVSGSEKIILAHDNLASIHQGGNPIFGNDGMLYISKGDGEENPMPKINAQNPMNIHGSVLRLDVSGDDFPDDTRRNYKIPDDNPFIDSPDILHEIYAFGFRSPWRITLDEETSDIYLGDVGWSDYEEINIIKPGNFGWGCTEGPLLHQQFACIDDPNFLPIQPVFAGKHNAFESITAGYVYRGSNYEAWIGKFFFADFTNGKLCIKSDEETACWDSSNSNTIRGNFVSFGEDHDNELYLANFNSGSIFRIDTTSVDCTNIADSIHVTTIDQGSYNATNHISIEVEDINGISFRTLEYDVLPITSIHSGSLYISSDICADFKNGINY